MKRFGFFLIFIFALALASNSRAAITAIGSLTTVSNTTVSSASLQTNLAPVSVGTFVVSNGGLAVSTNALSGVRQISLDGVNWVTVGAQYNPTSTNATSDTIPPAVFQVPVYLRYSVTTTNSEQVGVIYLP